MLCLLALPLQLGVTGAFNAVRVIVLEDKADIRRSPHLIKRNIKRFTTKYANFSPIKFVAKKNEGTAKPDATF